MCLRGRTSSGNRNTVNHEPGMDMLNVETYVKKILGEQK